MNQASLFDEAYSRRTDPPTSKAAAKVVRVNDLEMVVMAWLHATPGGMTCEELVDASGLPWNTVSPRLAPLRRKGLIYSAGKRAGRSGCQQLVWRCYE